jgi:hypothetical protein
MEVSGGDVALVRRVQAAVLGTGATGTMASFDSYDHVLRAAGYVRAPPSPGAAAIDREVVSTSRCEDCGHLGMDYHPYHKLHSYRALAACPACGECCEL